MNRLSFYIFITTALTIYGLLNYYFIRKHRKAITVKSLSGIFIKLLLLTLIAAPVATVYFSRSDDPYLAAISGFTGYGWLAFLFLFLVTHGVVDIVLCAIRKLGISYPEKIGKKTFIITTVFNVLILVYGVYAAKQVRVDRVRIVNEKIKQPVKIMQISDIHFSPLISIEMANLIKGVAIEEKPDIIVSTGDILDHGVRNENGVTDIMSSIKAPLGKLAIAGNHEYIAGIENSIEFINNSGFRFLRSESLTIPNILNFIAVDDITATRYGHQISKDESELYNDVDRELYTIVLKHQPRVRTDLLKRFELQLSGHTHAGQIFPFIFLVRFAFPYLCGMYDIDYNTRLYVSRGTGTWGPPIRILATPEITVFELMPK